MKCPFCIFETTRISDTVGHDAKMRYQVKCLGCGASGPICRTERTAKMRWTKVVNKVKPNVKV